MSSPSKPRVAPWLLILAAAALGCTHPAMAQTSEAPKARSGPRNLFDIGSWVVTHEQTARYGVFSSLGSSDSGTTFSMEDDLGLDKRSTATTLTYTRLIGAAWHFSADHLLSSRSSAVVTKRELQISGVNLPAGTTLQVEDRFSADTFAGGLALLQRGDTEFGLRVGGGFVRDRLQYESPTVKEQTSNINYDMLPMLGMFFSARPMESVQIDARADHLRDSDSRSTQLRLSVRWQPNAHVGLELAYWRYSGRLSVSDDPYSGNEEGQYKLSGPRVALRLAF